MTFHSKPKLLLHVCCAPCATVPLHRLSEKFDLTFFWYGPNIHPQSEHDRRLEEVRRLAQKNNLELIEQPYTPDHWEQVVGPFSDQPESSFRQRCQSCYHLRMDFTAQKAVELGFQWFTTTLSLSRHKNSKVLEGIGLQVAGVYGLSYCKENFKKAGGEALSVTLSKELDLYRQDYCGCRLSLIEARQRRQSKELQK